MWFAREPKRRGRKAAGFTLVELMIAMVLGLIVVGGSVALFISQRTTSRLSAQMAAVQAEGRIALDALARDVRAAGDFGCYPVPIIDPGINDTSVFDPKKGGLVGFQNGTVPLTVKARKDFETTTLVDMPLRGAAAVADLHPEGDGFVVIGVNGMLTQTSAAMSSSTDVVTVAAPASGQTIKTGDVLVATNCIISSIFEATAVAGAGPIQISHSAGSTAGMGKGNQGSKLGEAFKQGIPVGRLDFVWWFVATIDGKHGLYRYSARDAAPQLVSDNVQAFTATYDYETTPDREVKGLADVVGVKPSAVPAGAWANVRGVNLELLAKSAKPGASAIVPYTYNGVTVTPTDRNVYLPLKLTVALRN